MTATVDNLLKSTGATTSPESADPEVPSLRQRATRAAAWQMSVHILTSIMRIGSSAILARILFPKAFGLMALAYTVQRGLAMFSELGIGAAIIQSPHGDDPAFLNTAWTLQTIRGFGLFLGTCLLAWPAAAFFGEPDLWWLLPLCGIGAIVGGFSSTKSNTLGRHVIVGPTSRLTLIQDFITRVAMIVWAWWHPSVVAIAGGTLIGAVFGMAASHLMLPGANNRLHWDREAARALATFGKWVFIGTIIAFFGQQLDRLMLGRLEDTSLLGVYSIGITLMRIPEEATALLAGAVLYPVFATLVRQGSQVFPQRLAELRRVVLSASLLAVFCAVVASPWYFRLLYDLRYRDAVWMSQLGAIFVWMTILFGLANKAVLALGNTRMLAFAGVGQIAGTATCCLIGHHFFGVPGFVVGTGAGPFVGLLLLDVWLARKGMPGWQQDLRYSLLLIALIGVAFGLPRLLANSTPSHALALELVVHVVLFTGISAWAFRRIMPALLGRRKA